MTRKRIKNKRIKIKRIKIKRVREKRLAIEFVGANRIRPIGDFDLR